MSEGAGAVPFAEKYELIEKIATGGMAEVWRARQHGEQGFEKIVVIKKILPHLARDREFTALFESEGRIASQLQHVNIVQVIGLEEADGEYYMVMEHVHGLDLSRLMSRARNLGPFPIPLALYVVGEVLKALQYAHERTDRHGEPLRIVHCDISPQNILVSYAGEVKLTDFGISRAAFQAAGAHRVVRGKYAYMSPEQVEGRPLDARTDLFSAAIVLYELLTGRRLFKARTREETLARVRRAEVPSPRAYRPEVSEDLEAFLLRGLARRPEDRFQSAAEMLEALTVLMLREGHRATNNDLASFVREVIDAAVAAARGDPVAPRRAGRRLPPVPVVVLSAEAAPPPRSLASPRVALGELALRWEEIVGEAGGEIWERGEGSMLVVWVARGGLRASIATAVRVATALQRATLEAGYRLSAGLCPGVARISSDTHRPPEGWELAGPFYLARWMMNLSAHRGRVLLSGVGARQAGARTTRLGSIAVRRNRFIEVHELG